MLSLGLFELLLLGVLALIFIGPKQLPEVAAFSLRTFNQMKRVVQEAKKQLSFSTEDSLDSLDSLKPSDTSDSLQKPSREVSAPSPSLPSFTPESKNTSSKDVKEEEDK